INGFANSTVEAEFDIHTASEELVTNLKSFPSTITTYSTQLSDVRELEASSNEFKNLKSSVGIFYQSKIDGAETQIDAYYSKIDIAKSSSQDLSTAAKSKLSLRGLSANPSRRRQCSSEASQETWVERLASSLVSSVTISEFLSLNAGELRPDDLKKSDFSTSEANPFKLAIVDVDEEKSVGVDEVKSLSTRISPHSSEFVGRASQLKKRQDVVQTSIDNALGSAQIVLDNVNHHLQDHQDTFSVAEESVPRTKQSGSTLQKHVKQISKQHGSIFSEHYAAAVATTSEAKAGGAQLPSSNSYALRSSLSSICSI
ncbi:hypothetical protein CPC08DRAFT_730918, partial [Agrocybe pediades]